MIDDSAEKKKNYVEELVSELTQRLSVKSGDIDILRKLADDVFTCTSTLENLERKSDLENRTIKKTIANRLTGKACERYRKKAHIHAEEYDREPLTFEWMQTFLRAVLEEQSS